MKKNIIIFISGLIIGLFIMYSINYSAEKQQTDIVSASIDELKLVETVVKTKNAYDTLDPELSSSKSNLSLSSIPKKIIPTNSNNRIEGTIEKVKSKGENELQDVLYSIVGSIPENKLPLAIGYLEALTRKSADVQFEEQERDPEWAIKQEDKITYDFYEKQPLEGRAKLDNVTCKSTLCLVKLTIEGTEVTLQNSLPLLQFPGAKLTRLSPDETTGNTIMKLYIDPNLDMENLKKDNNENKMGISTSLVEYKIDD